MSFEKELLHTQQLVKVTLYSFVLLLLSISRALDAVSFYLAGFIHLSTSSLVLSVQNTHHHMQLNWLSSKWQ